MRTLGIKDKKISRHNSFNQVTTITTPSGSTTSVVNSDSNSEYTFKEGITAIGGPIDRWKWKLDNGQEASSILAGERFKAEWLPAQLSGSSTTLFTSPYHKTVTKYSKLQYVAQQVPPSGAQLSDSKADNIAKQVFVKKAREQQSAFMGGVFIGELRETLALLRPKSWALAKGMEHGYLDAVRNRVAKFGKRRGSSVKGKAYTLRDQFARRSEIVADTWLEHSFGWRPIINDIDSAKAELVRLVNKTKPESKRISSGFRSEEVAVIGANGANIPPLELLMSGKRTYSVDVRYKGAVKIQCQGGASVRESLGLTMSQFLPTLWELIPYSFLVDYFTNAGNIVSAASFPMSSLTYIVRGTKWRNEHQYLPGGAVRPTNTVFTTHEGTGYSGYSRLVKEGVFRTDYDDTLIPNLELSLPGHNRQLFNLAALGLASRRTQRLISTL